MVNAIVHGLALLTASTTVSSWEGMGKLLARTLASGDAKLCELASMLCEPCELYTQADWIPPLADRSCQAQEYR